MRLGVARIDLQRTPKHLNATVVVPQVNEGAACIAQNLGTSVIQFAGSLLIELTIAGIEAASAADLQAISRTSCDVLSSMGPEVQWVQSYVTGDKVYCVYNATSEQRVREHTRLGGFPIDSVARVVTTIDPTTAEV